MTIEASPLAETITRLFKDKVSTLEIEAICAGIWRSRILADRLSSLEVIGTSAWCGQAV